ncbi:hypothetical protein, variant [Sphaeroforma arctica JP610]|uniref:Uncharacterized protein n=1 Tax=Sphaeroforma arctica JP610 TaxID=667725 RepID=A0A0L0G167_9EUKA|nr:hypothetical protein, variant [Sphaeroforma arctica JP610]KNC81943.1 hypothetical protein, variant [Sphaeroforma arctica JP610]|eukprot:XP_014155845.1 hypothetical protein, variant [Sphaeroforma arctica JP610]
MTHMTPKTTKAILSKQWTAKEYERDVLDMFRGCTHSQLCRLPGLGARGVEVAMSLRPFESYDDMYQKFDSTKGVTVNAILSCQELLNELAEVDRLMAGCEKITKVMRQKITVNEDTDQTETDNAQPSCLTGTLKSYQLVGLKWLSLIYENKVGGILADEMGLGKTIQAIAYLAYVTEIEQGLYGAHCVICPASTIANWAREFEKWAPNMTVLQYTGPQASRQEIRAAVRQKKTKHAVLLTTYNNVGTASDRSFLAKQKFSVMICDEGHMLKNMGSQRYTQLHKFNARHRVLLTESRYSLELEEETEFGPEMDIVKRARNIMKPFVLRRLKKDVLGDLPKKTTHIEFCEMEANQKELYADLVNEIREQKESTDTKQIQNVMMQLRKMANHETLHRSHYGDDLCFKLAQRLQIEDEFEGKKVEHIQEELFFMSDFQIHTLCVKYPRLAKYQLDDEVRHSSAKLTWLGEHLPKMKERGDRVLLFSQFTVMLDILEDYLEHVGIGYLRLDGQTAVSERQDLIDEFDENEDILVFLLSTRAGGVGINLTASNTVILHDMDYNPHNDRQAEDRAHRVGQTRPVKVIKLVAKNTIDEAILHLANTKLALDQQMKGDKSGGGNNKADMEILLAESLGLAKLDNSSSK